MSRGVATGETHRFPLSVDGTVERLPHPFTLTWCDGLFLHWPVGPDVLRFPVPDPFLDTWG